MRILTRGDLDGLTSSVFLSIVEDIGEIRFAHPKDVQDGEIPVDKQDIIVNLPYVKGCGMWFDHHASEDRKLEAIGEFKGRFAVAPSAARVIHDHYNDPAFGRYDQMLRETDRLDSGQLGVEEVLDPRGWILLGLTLDPRTGLGPQFQRYFRWLVEYAKEVPLEKILQHREVNKRCEKVMEEQKFFMGLLKGVCKLDGNVIITDLRGVKRAPAGNRFLVFTMFPEANVEARIFDGKLGNTVVAVGKSIFNRSCALNVGGLLAEYGGGGHYGAGTAQMANDVADARIKEIVARLKTAP